LKYTIILRGSTSYNYIDFVVSTSLIESNMLYSLLFSVTISAQCHDPDTERHEYKTGRLDYGNMSDQLRMEKLVENIDNREMFMKRRFLKKVFGNKNVEYKDFCIWRGVQCDDEGVSVLEINWFNKSLKGTMDLSWIPPTVTYFELGANKIRGTLDTAQLPRNLKTISLYSNEFSGAVDWETLPPYIEYLSLSNNKLEGNVNLHVPPSSLTYIGVRNNKFSSVSGKRRERFNVSGIARLHKI